MCIIFLAINTHPTYPLVIASNRDEFLDRPTECMSLWDAAASHPGCKSTKDDVDTSEMRRSRRTSLAGRDLVAGGTWLGLDVSNKVVVSDEVQQNFVSNTDDSFAERNNSLRWIALTNYIGEGTKEDKLYKSSKASRGGLLTEFLQIDDQTHGSSSAESFANNLCDRGDEYNGFSALVADDKGVYYCTNRGRYPPFETDEIRDRAASQSSYYGPLPTGIYGLSNGLLDSPWPKITRGKEKLSALCKNTTTTKLEMHYSLLEMLHDEWKPTTDQYPDSDRCSIFVPEYDFDGRKYGTRSSTTILVEKCGKVSVLERTWIDGTDRRFELVPKKECHVQTTDRYDS